MLGLSSMPKGHGSWNQQIKGIHAQLLRKGGEFLTHVWLLIEQFNLKESFQKTRTRPKEEEANVSPGSESGGRATGSVSESGYGQGSGNGPAAVSGANAS